VSPLRFAFVTTFYPPYNFGGDGIGIQRFARALAKRGHHVTVIHDADAYDFLSGKRRATSPPSEEPGVEVISLRSGLGVWSLLLTQQLGRPVVNGSRIQEILNEGDFDVINFHNVSLAGGPRVFGYGSAVKLYMAHEHWLVCPSHVLWRHGRELCTGRECLRCQLHYRRPPQWWRYTGLLEREMDHIDLFIAMSEFSRDKHREFGFEREMEVLPYFLPDGPALEAAGAPPHDRPYFLFVGRLEKIKGLDDVIPQFRDYTGADLLIAGDGEYGATLRSLAAGNDRVRFLGRVPMDELRRYYRHAVALIVPSVCYETFGIILIEAMQLGTPVIARRIGPFPEIVRASNAGELFSDRAELVAAMTRMQTDPAYRARMSEAGPLAVQARWSESVVIPRYLELVRRAAERHGAAEVVEKLRGEILGPEPTAAST
jgi:glycosyltransferase involved in cell wall biosynthesis